LKSIGQVLNDIRPEFDFAASEDFMSDGMLDSFDMITLVSDLDKEHGISIAGMDIVPENFQSIASIERLLQKYKKA
jgi:acyl carrier protein